MDNKEEKFTRKEATAKKYEELEKRRNEMSSAEYAKELEKIDVEDLVQEFIPLLKDFFVGEFTGLQNMILCTFYNDEKFKITIEKVEDDE